MDEQCLKRTSRTVRPTVDLTTRVFNTLINEAYNISSHPLMMPEDHEWMTVALSAHRDILANVAEHEDAIRMSIESALSQALLGLPAEELAKKNAEAHLLEVVAPATVGELAQRLTESCDYASASFSQIKSLRPEAQEYCKQFYVELQNHLNAKAQELLSKPRVRSV